MEKEILKKKILAAASSHKNITMYGFKQVLGMEYDQITPVVNELVAGGKLEKSTEFTYKGQKVIQDCYNTVSMYSQAELFT